MSAGLRQRDPTLFQLSFIMLRFLAPFVSIQKKKSDVVIVSTNEFILNLTMGI